MVIKQKAAHNRAAKNDNFNDVNILVYLPLKCNEAGGDCDETKSITSQ